ncbi:MAG: RNA polymerase sigma factor [Tepidibacillus sp.]
MHSLAKKFINENEENNKLYRKAILEHDMNACSILNEKFKSYLFKIHATSYLHKSIVLSARELKRRHLKVYKREELTLNTTDSDFNEERIDSIPDKPVDFIEEITKPKSIDFTEMFTDQILASAMNNLTDKQKEILFLRFVEELEEKEIAKRLETSIQAVNKVKKAALERIKKQLRGGKNGLF